jgi:DNA replication initiation complex subunit (GINS family)
LYDELFAAWKLEKNSEAIQPLPSDFFDKVLNYLLGLKESRLHEKAGSSIESARKREVDYTEFMLSDLLKMRARKIVSLSLEDPTESGSHLVDAEAELVKSLHGLLRDYEERRASPSVSAEIKSGANQEKREISSAETQDASGLMLLRVLQPIPKLVGVDLDVYGPFQPEDIVSLPRENALVLIARGAASEVKI